MSYLNKGDQIVFPYSKWGLTKLLIVSFSLELICMVKHLLGENYNKAFKVQKTLNLYLFFRNTMSFSLRVILNNVLSSANKEKSECWTTSIRIVI